jgi:hypothetical protein
MTTRPLCVRAALCATALMVAAGTAVLAGGDQPAAQAPAKPDTLLQTLAKPDALLQTIPVRIDVVLTRLQGEKKISSLPFSLLANAKDARDRAEPVSIRMGIDVPVGSSTETDNRTTPSGGNGATRSTETTTTKTQYRSVGTDLDCWATRLDENRFSIRVSVSDSSIYAPDADAKSLKNAEPAAFRTFSTSNTVMMRDGQTILFGTGTDKISGETLKIEVTLHVVK